MSREVAIKQLAVKVAMIDALVAECREIARDNSIDFYLDIGYELGRVKDTLNNDGWMSSSYNC